MPAAVSGLQPKIAVRLVNGTFIEGLSEDELCARYEACADLVEQLTLYCRRKLAEGPDVSLSTLLPRVRLGATRKEWGLSEAELGWIMAKVEAVLSPPPNSTDCRA